MGVDNFEIVKGNLGVLLSAPHCFIHKRPSIRGVFKQPEPRTDKIAKEVASRSNAWSIFVNSPCVDYDPNFSKVENNPYKEKVKELFNDNKINYFIDIHGLSDFHDYDLGIYYNMRYKRSKDLAYKLLKVLGKNQDLKDISYHVGYTIKNNQETLTEYVSEKLKYPAIQIEIAKYIRNDPRLIESLIDSLTSFIQNL